VRRLNINNGFFLLYLKFWASSAIDDRTWTKKEAERKIIIALSKKNWLAIDIWREDN